MGNKENQLCYNCKYRSYNGESGITECLISNEQKECYFTHWSERYNDVDWCPFKELEDGGEYTYWH